MIFINKRAHDKKLLLIYENEKNFFFKLTEVSSFLFVLNYWYRLIFISNYNYEAKNKDVKECFPN